MYSLQFKKQVASIQYSFVVLLLLFTTGFSQSNQSELLFSEEKRKLIESQSLQIAAELEAKIDSLKLLENRIHLRLQLVRIFWASNETKARRLLQKAIQDLLAFSSEAELQNKRGADESLTELEQG